MTGLEVKVKRKSHHLHYMHSCIGKKLLLAEDLKVQAPKSYLNWFTDKTFQYKVNHYGMNLHLKVITGVKMYMCTGDNDDQHVNRDGINRKLQTQIQRIVWDRKIELANYEY